MIGVPAPRVSEVSAGYDSEEVGATGAAATAVPTARVGHLVEWCPVRCFNDDPVSYVLQIRISTRDHDYTTVTNKL